MNRRQVDLALLAGIGILLILILVLALSAAPRLGASDISDPVLSVVSPPEATPRTVPADPSATVEETPVQEDPTPEESIETPEAVPEEGVVDAVPIARIGFAYATGTAGACGVPLTAWDYIAVSRDLLETYPCGTAVTLTLADEVAGRTEVVAQVGDTMGADITDTVNIFVGEGEPALEYGVTRGTLSP